MKKNKKIKKKREGEKKEEWSKKGKNERKRDKKKNSWGGRKKGRKKMYVGGAGWKKGGGDSLNPELRRANAFIIRRFNLSGSSRSVTVPGVN